MKSRLVIVEQVVHYPDEMSQPTSFEGLGFTRHLESDEQSYTRRIRITHEWQPLDVGWCKECGVSQLILRNEEGRGLTQNPSEEEREAIKGRIIWLASNENGDDLMTPFAELRPGESLRISPTSVESWYTCALSQEPVRATIICVPR